MEIPDVQMTHKEFLIIDQDYEEAAAAVNLVYVKDNVEGIARIKKGNGFAYTYRNKTIKDKKIIERIRKLVIPPAWKNVWICYLSNGHIQATGTDLRERKQYRYHAQWNALRNITKFHRLFEFGKSMPTLRTQLEKDIALTNLTEEKVLATVIALMERTYIRIGNEGYEKLYGSYGLTTLKDKHVGIQGTSISFSFKGKKGIFHNITIRNKKLAKIVKECRDIPGSELFQYYDADGNRKSIDSGKVNQYIKNVTEGDFTAKDFRLWAGSLNILRAFKSLGQATTEVECKQKIVTALDEVSQKLGNTRTVCRKYYVHPGLIKLYEQNNLEKYLKDLDDEEIPDDNRANLTRDEKVLMKILKTLN